MNTPEEARAARTAAKGRSKMNMVLLTSDVCGALILSRPCGRYIGERT
jgi:hypothetical protein